MIRLPHHFFYTALCGVVLFTSIFYAADSIAAESDLSEKTILLINPSDVLSAAAQSSDQGMYAVFSKSEQRIKFLSEYLHLGSDSILEADSRALIERKYSGRHIDLIMARGEEALDFVEQYGQRLWPNVPVLYFSLSDTSRYKRQPPAGKNGVFMAHDYASNLALIKILQPSVRRVIQLTDMGDKASTDKLQRELQTVATALQSSLIVETAPPMTQTALLKYVAALPDNTALLAFTLNSASDEIFYSAGETMRALSEASSVPVYGMRQNFIGNGAVGGHFIDFVKHGNQVASLALRILANPALLPVLETTRQDQCIVDELQLHRWHLNASALPANCERLSYTPAFWDRYGYLISGAIFIALILFALSFLLNWQWVRRRRAEEETKHQRTALAHVARLGSVGELTASIVHEINQPLGAILTNADAAAMMLKQHTSSDEELQAILKDIRDDNLRASRIIQKLRTLLSKRSLETVSLSLNEVIANSKSLLGNMAIRYHVVLHIDLTENLPSIMGDNTHLQQVLINLVSNGMEAMKDLPPPQRILTITTKKGVGNTVLLIVADKGPGITQDALPRMFESFYTTKPEGMGMGLSIVQTIIDVHGGSIEVKNSAQGGAVFKITLPCTASHS